MKIFINYVILRSKSQLFSPCLSQSRLLRIGRADILKNSKLSSFHAQRIPDLASQIRNAIITSYRIKRTLSMMFKLGAACLIGGGTGLFLASLNKRHPKAQDDMEREPKSNAFLTALQTVSIVTIAWGSAILLLQIPIRAIPGGLVMTRSLQRVVFRWTYGGASGLTSMILQSWPLRGLWYRLQVIKWHVRIARIT
jgi:hypothetical protein